MPLQLKLPASKRLAAMVVHTRPMLLEHPERPRRHLYYGVQEADFPTLSTDPDAAELELPSDHVVDFADPDRLARLGDWLHSELRTEKAFAKLFGRDLVFLHALAVARDTARVHGEPRDRPPVLIQGPSGSGKELLARAIHDASGCPGEFVAVHCAGITPELLEDTLFGHAKGAFTGAQGPRRGLVELAKNGTLFIDEVADLPPQAQVALLRFLQDQRYRTIGEDTERQANVRVVCATWKPIDQLAEKQTFRPDLLYRIAGVRIVLPGLKDRLHELLGLAEAIATDAGVSSSPPLDPEAALAVQATEWPGGLRQLDREIREAARRSGGATVRLHHLPPERVVNFHEAEPAVRIAASALAWSPSGRRPSAAEITTRLQTQLAASGLPPADEARGDLVLVRRIQDSFRADDPTYSLLDRLAALSGQEAARKARREVLERLLDLLPEAVAGEVVQQSLEELSVEELLAATEIGAVSAEVAQRLPGLAQIFSFVYAIPGLPEHERNRLLQASAQIVSVCAKLLPNLVSFGVRKLAANRLETLFIEEQAPVDPDNPFNSDVEPGDRPASDWQWLAANARSIADAERISGCAKNTIRRYFNTLGLTIDRSRPESPSPSTENPK